MAAAATALLLPRRSTGSECGQVSTPRRGSWRLRRAGFFVALARRGRRS